MLTNSRTFCLAFFTSLLILQFFTNCSGQQVEAKIEVRADEPSIVHVSGRFLNPGSVRNLSFIRSFAGFSDLGERIHELKLVSAANTEVRYQTAVPGEYVADAEFTGWSYTFDLSPRKEQAAAAQISWIANGRGLLMLGDVLPLNDVGKKLAGKVVIALPVDWRQLENRVDGILESVDLRSEVVTVGNDVRYRMVHVGGTAISICISGQWHFTSDDATSFAQGIYGELAKSFGGRPSDRVFINLFNYPDHTSPGQWHADTRGRNVTIMSSDMPFKTQSLQRLHEQLRHELFHLWIPNGVNLTGNYDWFYEGFALYMSLKLAVELKRIRFEDMLDTLSRAHAIDKRQANRLSLIEASKKRWNGLETYIYARGMLTAFLCDLMLLNDSNGKRSVTEVVREVYARHKVPAKPLDGNDAVLKILGSRPELETVVEKYIKGNGPIEWQSELSLGGLESNNGLVVASKLSGKQKDVLKGLGYNN